MTRTFPASDFDSSARESDPVKLSVIVCTRNRSRAMLLCLESVVQSLAKAAPLEAEIVVIDNGSVDDTPSILRAWASKIPFPVSLQFEPRKGLAYARNCGLRAARGALLIWTDDDCRLAPDHITTALKYDLADGEQLVFRGGSVKLGDASDFPISVTWRQETQRWHRKKHPHGYLSLSSACMGANMMMRRALVDKIGSFDERFGAGSNIPAGEEVDYIIRAYAAGMMLEFAPDLIVHHHHGRKTIADARNIMRNYLIATGAVHTKHVLRHPLTSLPVVWAVKDALVEILAGEKNRFMPEIGFSYRKLLSCFVVGTSRFMLASIRPRRHV
jgi:glycosyltransferase involved in cell wall biosynthesis